MQVPPGRARARPVGDGTAWGDAVPPHRSTARAPQRPDGYAALRERQSVSQ